MKRLALITIGSLAAVLIGVAAPAAAGGWAVSTLDEMPVPAAGEEQLVGFTIRQHGVTPVNPTDGEIGIEITAPSGVVEFFPATQEGTTGHYAARVVFPAQGEFTWAVHQGWFAAQDLGSIQVGGTSGTGLVAGSASGRDYSAPAWVRYGLPLVALALGAYAVVDGIAARRRRTAAVSAMSA